MEYVNSHSKRKGKRPLNEMTAKDGREFWTMAPNLEERSISLASHGMTLRISS